MQFLGADRLVTMDLHAPAVTGAVGTKTVWDDYECGFIGIDYFNKIIDDKKELTIVAPDAGAAKRAKQFHAMFEAKGYEG